MKNKVIVLDFWNTHCGICFKEFPDSQRLYNEYKDNPSVVFLAVNKPLKGDSTRQAYTMIQDRNYTFSTIIPDDHELPEKFGVKYYPTTIILNKEGNAVFFGSVEMAGKVIQGLIIDSK